MPPRALALVLGAVCVARATAAWTPPLLPLSALDARANGARSAARALLAMTGLAAAADDAQAEVRNFRGAIYGVVASVALDLSTRHANVTLRGVPLGGTLSGAGSPSSVRMHTPAPSSSIPTFDADWGVDSCACAAPRTTRARAP